RSRKDRSSSPSRDRMTARNSVCATACNRLHRTFSVHTKPLTIMKTKLIPLCIALVTCGLTALAQDAKPAAAAATPPKPAGADAAATPANPNEVVPLIVIDDVPLTTAIQNLARQANLNFQFDPRISGSNQPNVTIRFENVTAQEALAAVLDNHNLALVK